MARAASSGIVTAQLRPTAQPRLSARARERLLALALLAPACLLVFGMIAYPVVYDVALALSDAHDFGAPGRLVGLSNFAALLTNSQFWEAAANSALYTAATSVLRLALGVGIALVLWQLRRARLAVFLGLFVTWVFPAALSAFAFYWMFSPPFHTFYGVALLKLRFALAGLIGQDLWHVGIIAFHDIWRSSAFIAIFMLAGFNSLPTDPLEYAALECRNAWQRFWYVALPMLRKFVILAMILSLVISFLDYSNVYIQTGGRIIWPLVGTFAYRTWIWEGDSGLGAAITLAQLPAWFLLLWIGFRLFEREPRRPAVREVELPAVASEAVPTPAETAVSAPTPVPPPWRKLWHRIWLTIAAALIAVFALFPFWWMIQLAIRPVVEDRYGNPFWTWHPTLESVTEAFEGRNIWLWMRNTAFVMVVGVALTLAVSLLAGYALGRLRFRGRRWIARALFASYFLPQPMVLVPIYQVFLFLNLDNTLAAVVLISQTLTIPFATWLFFTYFDGLPAEIEEHASLEGSRWQVFLKIVLPMSWPVIIAAGIFAAGVLMSDFLYAGLLLVHNDVKTLAVGLGMIGISLDEFNSISGAIGLAAAPLVIACALFAPAYVRGLSAAMVEGS
jgi:multiple sugar transport system permease protein